MEYMHQNGVQGGLTSPRRIRWAFTVALVRLRSDSDTPIACLIILVYCTGKAFDSWGLR